MSVQTPPTPAFLPLLPATRRTRRQRQCLQRRSCPCSSIQADSTAPSSVKTIVYGEALMDLYSNKSHAKLKDKSAWQAYPGGAPLNLACALGKLGHPTAYIGALGADDHGTSLHNELSNANVNTTGLQTHTSPTRAVYVRNTNGKRSFAGYTPSGAAAADAQELNTALVPGALFYSAQLLATGTLALASPGSAATQRALTRLAHATRTRIFVDVNWRPVFWRGINDARAIICKFLEDNAAYVKMSLDDARFLLDDGDSALENPAGALDGLGRRCRGVLVTDGARGAAYAFRSGDCVLTGRVDAFDVDTVDDTGAGDAFLAGFIAQLFHVGGFEALADQVKIKSVARFATAAACSVVLEKGAVGPQPSREQVESFLQGREAEHALTP